MRKLTISLLAMALLFAGCQKPELVGPAEENSSFDASVEVFNVPTKTSLASNNRVVWSSDDRLAIFQGSTYGDEYKYVGASAGSNNSSFDLVSDNSSLNGSFFAGTELPCNVAYYPYADGMELFGDMEGTKAEYVLPNVVLPATQKYAANSFANGAFPMIAVTSSMADHDLKFKNILGAMRISLKGTQIVKSIKVEGLNGEKLSGASTVTAYANNQVPAIKMSDGASTVVTLDCGDGVQLDVSKATYFYLALPPVSFENGFKAIVTDAAGQAHTMIADQNNAVLRSSILVMPEVTFETPVTGVALNSTSLELYVDENAQLEATVIPVNATDKTVEWSSEDPTIATVDQTGLVTPVAVGTTTIKAAAGDKQASCSVTVNGFPVATTDYVDEYGVNHGKGTTIRRAVWAPVNCGYHEAEYKWGKLYQWGRKYGQGYDDDATTPTISRDNVSLQEGQSENNKNIFFRNWSFPSDGTLWNSGTEESPKKTEYDPCPEGWRVPTFDELSELCKNYSGSTTDESGQSGYWFSGLYQYTSEVAQVFFHNAGYRFYNTGIAKDRGEDGYYWSSKLNNEKAYYLNFGSGSVGMNSARQANAYSVRCVQE